MALRKQQGYISTGKEIMLFNKSNRITAIVKKEGAWFNLSAMTTQGFKEVIGRLKPIYLGALIDAVLQGDKRLSVKDWEKLLTEIPHLESTPFVY